MTLYREPRRRTMERALIPTLLSLYLVVKNQLFVRGLAGVAVVALIVHPLAQPVEGVGISVPVFIPPLVDSSWALSVCVDAQCNPLNAFPQMG